MVFKIKLANLEKVDLYLSIYKLEQSKTCDIIDNQSPIYDPVFLEYKKTNSVMGVV